LAVIVSDEEKKVLQHRRQQAEVSVGISGRVGVRQDGKLRLFRRRKIEAERLVVDAAERKSGVVVETSQVAMLSNFSFSAAPINKSNKLVTNWAQCYKTFYDHNLRIFVISYLLCPWQTFPA
jgi:hypothetical protein